MTDTVATQTQVASEILNGAGVQGYRRVDSATAMENETREIVRQFVRNYIDERRKAGETHQAIADRLGISKAHVVNMHHGRSSGPKVEDAVARVLFAGSVDDLRQAARDWWDAGGRVVVDLAGRAEGTAEVTGELTVLPVRAIVGAGTATAHATGTLYDPLAPILDKLPAWFLDDEEFMAAGRYAMARFKCEVEDVIAVARAMHSRTREYSPDDFVDMARSHRAARLGEPIGRPASEDRTPTVAEIKARRKSEDG